MTPRHEPYSEKEILGTLLIDPTKFNEISEKISCDHFADTFHREVFEQMGELSAKHGTFDVAMILQRLEIDEDDNDMLENCLYELGAQCGNVSNVFIHAEKVREAWRVRQLLYMAELIIFEMRSEKYIDIDDFLCWVDGKIKAISEKFKK